MKEKENSGGYQFVHKIWVKRSRASKDVQKRSHRIPAKSSEWTVHDVLREAMRFPGHIKHVKSPQHARIIYACNPDVEDNPLLVEEIANAWAESVKITSGRAHPINSPVLACGVIAFPRDRESEWERFRDACSGWLLEKYGERLKLVVEHLDESNPHCHYFAIPLFDVKSEHKWSEDFGVVHEGYARSREARRNYIRRIKSLTGSDEIPLDYGGSQTGIAYRSAMIAYQDRFHEEVGRNFGLARVGPRIERLKYREAILEQVIRKQNSILEECNRAAEVANQELEAIRGIRAVTTNEMAKKLADFNRDADIFFDNILSWTINESFDDVQDLVNRGKLIVEEERKLQLIIDEDELGKNMASSYYLQDNKEFYSLQDNIRSRYESIAALVKKFRSSLALLRNSVEELECARYSSLARNHLSK